MAFKTLRTVLRAIFEELKTSSPSSCRERLTVVSTTFLAFLDINIAVVIITPAATKKYCLPGNVDGPAKTSALKLLADCPSPLTVKSIKASKPAKGVPIKFTKSLPAKAIARENVPNKTTTLKIFTCNRCSISIKIVKQTKHPPNNNNL